MFGGRPAATTATASADPSVAALSTALAPTGSTTQYVLPPPTTAPQQVASAAFQPTTAQAQAPSQYQLPDLPEPVVKVPLPPVRPASLAFHAAPEPVQGAALAYAGNARRHPALPDLRPDDQPRGRGPRAGGAGPGARDDHGGRPRAGGAPAEDAKPATPMPPRRPVEFRHFVLRKPAPPVPQTAAATPEPAATAVSQ